MVHPIQVTSFTPVVTGNSFFDAPAFYLSLPGCRKEIAVLKFSTEKALENESRPCSLAPYETTWIASAFKIITYVLSLGLLPALAALWIYATRSDNQFHYDVEVRIASPIRTPLPGPQGGIVEEVSQTLATPEESLTNPLLPLPIEQEAPSLGILKLVEILKHLQQETPEISHDILMAEVIKRVGGDPFHKEAQFSEARQELFKQLTEDLKDLPLQELIDRFEVASSGDKPMDQFLAVGFKRNLLEQLKQLNLQSLTDLLKAKGWMENIYDENEVSPLNLEILIKETIIEKLGEDNPFSPDSEERAAARGKLEVLLNPSLEATLDEPPVPLTPEQKSQGLAALVAAHKTAAEHVAEQYALAISGRLAECKLIEIIECLQEQNLKTMDEMLKAEVIKRVGGDDPFPKAARLSDARGELLKQLTKDLKALPLQTLIDKLAIVLPGNKPMDQFLAVTLRARIRKHLKHLNLKSLTDLLKENGSMQKIYDPLALGTATIEMIIKDEIIEKLGGANPFHPKLEERTKAQENLEAALNPNSVEAFD